MWKTFISMVNQKSPDEIKFICSTGASKHTGSTDEMREKQAQELSRHLQKLLYLMVATWSGFGKLNMGDPWTDLSGMRKSQLNLRQQCAPESWIILKGPSEEKFLSLIILSFHPNLCSFQSRWKSCWKWERNHLIPWILVVLAWIPVLSQARIIWSCA